MKVKGFCWGKRRGELPFRETGASCPKTLSSTNRCKCVWRDAKHGGRDARAPLEPGSRREPVFHFDVGNAGVWGNAFNLGELTPNWFIGKF